MHPFTHIDVANTDEVIPLLNATTRPLAGGTDLLPLMKEELAAPERLINLKHAADLRYIRNDDTGLQIGALTTLDELDRHPDIRRGYTALAQAAGLAASPQLRNMATLGGNLLQQVRCWYYRGDFHCWLKGGEMCQARDGRNDYHAIFEQSPCVAVHPSDPPAALIALDARLRIVNGMITNDKFCMTRLGHLQLSWSRYDVYLARKRRTTPDYPSDELVHRGGPHETAVAHPPTDNAPSPWPTTLGSSLPTTTAMDACSQSGATLTADSNPWIASGETSCE